MFWPGVWSAWLIAHRNVPVDVPSLKLGDREGRQHQPILESDNCRHQCPHATARPSCYSPFHRWIAPLQGELCAVRRVRFSPRSVLTLRSVVQAQVTLLGGQRRRPRPRVLRSVVRFLKEFICIFRPHLPTVSNVGRGSGRVRDLHLRLRTLTDAEEWMHPRRLSRAPRTENGPY